MATHGDITANMGIQMQTGAMQTTLQGLQRQIDGIVAALNKAATQAEAAVNKTGKAGERAIQKAEQSAAQAARSMGKVMGQFETVRGANARGLLGAFQQDQRIGKSAEQMAKFQLALEGGGTAQANLNRRIAEGTQEFARMARAGQQLTAQDVRRQAGLRETLSRVDAINRSQRGIFESYGRLSKESQAQLDPMFGKLNQLNNELGRLSNRNNRFSFGTNLGEQERITAELRRQITSLQKQETQNTKLTQQVRERAQAILTASDAERRALLQAGANRYASMAGAGGNNAAINGLIGSPVQFRQNTDLMERFNTATKLATLNKIQLNNALNSNAGAARIQQLIDRYERLNRLQQQALGLQAAQNNQPTGQQGGFFGGFRHATGNLLRGEGEGGGMFGAGALVGRVASYAVAATAIYGLINSIREGARFAIEFEDNLAQLGAISGATGLEMQRLSQNILDVAKNSNSSVNEITKSATVLAQAGYSANETQLMLQNVVNLSAASGATPDQSVDILTSALGAFQLQAEESTHVADALVSVLNESKLAVNQVQLGLQYVGATAKESNITLETLVASLGAMADAGIRSGSTMSTGMRQMIRDLRDPSEKTLAELQKIGLTVGDIDIKTRGFIPVLKTLRDAGFDAYGTLETRAAAAYLVLSNNIPNIERLRAATLAQNTAAEAQAKRMDSLSAQWQAFKNQLSEIGNTLGQAIIPLLKNVISAFSLLAEVVNITVNAIGALDDMLDPMGWLGYGDSIQEAETALDEAQTALNDASASAKSQEEQIGSLDDEILSILSRYDDLRLSNSETSYEVDRLSQRFPGLRSEFDKTRGGIAGLISSLFNLRQEFIKTLQVKQETEMGMLRASDRAVRNSIEARGRGLTSQYGNTENDLGGLGLITIRRGRPETGAIVSKLRSPNMSTYYEGLRDLEKFMQRDDIPASLRNSFERDARAYIADKSKALQYREDYQTLRNEMGATNFMASAEGRSVAEATSVTNARGQTLEARYGQEPLNVRRNAVSGALADAERLRDTTKAYAEKAEAAGLKGEAQAARNLLATQQQTVNTLKSLSNPTDEETKQAERDAKAGRAAGKRAEAEARRQQREAERAALDAARDRIKVLKETVDTEKKQLASALNILEKEESLANINDLQADVIDQFEDYREATLKLAAEEIAKDKLTTEQAQQYLAEITAQLDEEYKNTVQTAAKNINSAINDFISKRGEDADEAFRNATRDSRIQVNATEGRLAGFSDPLNAGVVPEYVRVVQQRRVQVAQRDLDLATMRALDDKIATREADLQLLEDTYNAIGNEDIRKAAFADYQSSVRQTREELFQLELQQDSLLNQYRALENAPDGWTESIKSAINAFRIQNNIGISIGQRMRNELGGALDVVHQGFQSFFSDIVTGTTSVADAFGNMARSVMSALADMAAKAVATQVFGLLLSFITPTPDFIKSPMNVPLTGDLSAIPRGYTGGFFDGRSVKRFLGGGLVSAGIPTRDATPALLSKGEFVMRRSSVENIGHRLLMDMNNRGAAALSKLQNNTIISPQTPPVETSVYVMLPDEKPQLGPNDVVAIVNRDMLTNGTTKALVKQISRGG